jgi:hypothetical protein
MSSFEVIGGNKLKGEIIPQGAKNEALQVLSAVLLTAEPGNDLQYTRYRGREPADRITAGYRRKSEPGIA